MDYFSISWVPQISLPSLPHARDTPTHKRPQMATHTSARGGRPSSPHARRPAAPTAESARGHARRWPHTPALADGGGARPVPGGQRCPRQSQHMAAPAAETPCRHSSAAAGVRLLARRNRARARLAASEPRPRPEVPNPRRGLDRDWLLRPRRTQQRRRPRRRRRRRPFRAVLLTVAKELLPCRPAYDRRRQRCPARGDSFGRARLPLP